MTTRSTDHLGKDYAAALADLAQPRPRAPRAAATPTGHDACMAAAILWASTLALAGAAAAWPAFNALDVVSLIVTVWVTSGSLRYLTVHGRAIPDATEVLATFGACLLGAAAICLVLASGWSA